MIDFTLRAESREQMQSKLQNLGIHWDGTSEGMRHNDIELFFFGTVIKQTEEGPEALPYFHADAVAPEGTNFGDLEIQVEGPRFHTIA